MIKIIKVIEVILLISYLAQILLYFRNKLKRLFIVPRKKKEPKNKIREKSLNLQIPDSRSFISISSYLASAPGPDPGPGPASGLASIKFNPIIPTTAIRPYASVTSRRLNATFRARVKGGTYIPASASATAMNSIKTISLLKDILKEINV